MKKSDLKITGKILSKEEYKAKYSKGLQQKLGRLNMSVQDLQRATNISYYGLWKIVNGEAMPNLYSAYRISTALKEAENADIERGRKI